MAAERSSRRSVAAGVVGSAAVLLVAALSLILGRAHAQTLGPEPRPAAARPAAPPRAQPAVGTKPNAAWLRKLLQRSDLKPVEPPAARS